MAASLAPLFLLILPACLIQQTIGVKVERRRWLRTVDGDTTARESARFSKDMEYIQLFSLVPRSKKVQIQSAFSAYDFKAGMAAARLRINSAHVCVVFPVTGNFTAAVDAIKNRSMDKRVETPGAGERYIMKTDSKMTDAELKDLKSKSQFLYEICQGQSRKKRITILDETSAVTDEDVSGLEHETFMSIYGKVSIYLKSTVSL